MNKNSKTSVFLFQCECKSVVIKRLLSSFDVLALYSADALVSLKSGTFRYGDRENEVLSYDCLSASTEFHLQKYYIPPEKNS